MVIPSFIYAATTNWNGNGTDNGYCHEFQNDSDLHPGAGQQGWLFILTSPQGSSWNLTTTFDPSTQTPSNPISGNQQGGGSVHFIVYSNIDAKLLSASATNGSNNSQLTVSHCEKGSSVPPTHKECVRNTCQVVQGAGDNTCTDNNSCNSDDHHYYTCNSDHQCVRYNGIGNNTCDNDDENACQQTPVNCIGSWSNNSTCSLTCGGGVLQQVFTITTPASNGGTACAYNNGDTRWGETSCNTNSCSVTPTPTSGQTPPGGPGDGLSDGGSSCPDCTKPHNSTQSVLGASTGPQVLGLSTTSGEENAVLPLVQLFAALTSGMFGFKLLKK